MIDVEWRDKYVPAYVDADMLDSAFSLPMNADKPHGLAMLACTPSLEKHYPSPPYAFWIGRVLLVDLVESKKNGTIVATVLVSHAMFRPGDTEDAVRIEYLARVSQFVSKCMKDLTDAP